MLAGSDRPLVITSGTGLARSKTGAPAMETDDPVTSAEHPRAVTKEEAADYFGALANLVTIDLAASGALTRQQLGWTPTGPALLTDLRNMDYGEA